MNVSAFFFDTRGNLKLEGVVKAVGLLLVLILAFLFLWPFTSVPTGSRGVLTQFGAIKGIESEGLVTVWPWQKVYLFSIRSEAASIDKATGSTSDQQPVDTDLTVRYSIRPDKVSEVFERYTHTGDLQNYVQTATQEVFKAVTARYTAPDLIAKREQVSSDILAGLQSKLDKYGAQVINIDMRNFDFSKSYMDAINEKVTQEQKRLAAENKLKTVEAEQKQKVAIAEAEASATRARADGEAYATVKAANASAQALQVQNDALAKSKEVLELRRIEVDQTKAEKWDGKLPENIYASAPIPFLNVPQQHN